MSVIVTLPEDSSNASKLTLRHLEPADRPGTDPMSGRGPATGPASPNSKPARLTMPLYSADHPATVGEATIASPRIECRNVNVFYGAKQAVQDLTLDIGRHEVIALIGPSGCGKTTFLRCLNRMNDTIDGCRVTGEIKIDGENIYRDGINVVPLRALVGMVFQKPNPFPKSIYENIAFGPRIHGMATRGSDLDRIVEDSLRRAGLWDEVKDGLDAMGSDFGGPGSDFDGRTLLGARSDRYGGDRATDR